MTMDHPVFVPTSAGPLGGIVTEPDGDERGAAVILEGINGRRAGVNQIWTHAARALTDLGLVVLRLDYPGRGDSRPAAPGAEADLALVEGIGWFRERTAGLGLHLVGSCFGVRPAAAVAEHEPTLNSLTLHVPYLMRVPSRRLVARAARRFRRELAVVRSPSIDDAVCSSIVAAARRAPTVVVAGEQDAHLSDAVELRRRAGRDGVDIEVVVVPGATLHGHRSVQGQRSIVAWLAACVSAAIEEREDGRRPDVPVTAPSH